MHNGIAIVLSWPETLCKQAGSWYDPMLQFFALNKNNYYKIGHAAIVLIDNKTEVCHYFDFGRYHSPHQHGRVRSAFTDHELEIKTKAKVGKNNTLENYEEILLELKNNESCHGSGALHGSYCAINFNNAFNKAMKMQNTSPIAYGPLLLKATNCSRFVRTIALSGKPKFIFQLTLGLPLTVSPTPIGNVRAVQNYKVVSDLEDKSETIKPTDIFNKNMRHETSRSIT